LLVRGHAGAYALVDLGLLDPTPQRVLIDPELFADATTRRGDTQLALLLQQVEDQPDRPGPHLDRILLRRWHGLHPLVSSEPPSIPERSSPAGLPPPPKPEPPPPPKPQPSTIDPD